MGENVEQTLNAVDDVDGAGESSPPDEPGDQDITESSTVEDDAASSAETLSTDKGGEEDASKEEAGADKGDADKGKEGQTVPYDRFQEVITEKNDALERAIKAETERDAERARAETDAGEEKGKDFEDITKLSKEEAIEQLNEDPIAFLANYGRQVRTEVLEEVTAKSTEEKSEADILSTYNEYAEKNPDFDEMWKKGTIQAYMQKNPGHNAISAHMTLTGEKKTQEKIEAAKKETEKDVIAKVKSKKGASVLGEGPSGTEVHEETVDSELKDSKKHGGLTSLISKRLERSRQKGVG